MEYLFNSVEDCMVSGQHLKSVDENGFCNLCGHQDCGDFDDYINDEELLAM